MSKKKKRRQNKNKNTIEPAESRRSGFTHLLAPIGTAIGIAVATIIGQYISPSTPQSRPSHTSPTPTVTHKPKQHLSLDELASIPAYEEVHTKEISELEPDLMRSARMYALRNLQSKGKARFVSLTPKKIIDKVHFAPNNPNLQKYAQQQAELTEKIKQYFHANNDYKIFVASKVEELFFTDQNTFMGPVVASRSKTPVLSLAFTLDGKLRTEEISASMNDNSSGITSIFNYDIDENKQLQITPIKEYVVLKPIENAPFDASGPFEYMHFCAKPSELRDHKAYAMAFSKLEGSTIVLPQINATTPFILANEGYVHGCVIAALEELEILNHQEAVEFANLHPSWDPKYVRVPEIYQKARAECVHKVWLSYIDGKHD